MKFSHIFFLFLSPIAIKENGNEHFTWSLWSPQVVVPKNTIWCLWSRWRDTAFCTACRSAFVSSRVRKRITPLAPTTAFSVSCSTI